MKKITLLIAFALSFISNAQIDALSSTSWKLSQLRINSENIFPPNDDDVEEVLLNMLEDEDPLTEDFITNVCNTLTTGDGMVIYNESAQTFTLPALTQTLFSCDAPENEAFEEACFNFFYDNQTTPFFFSIVELGGAILLDISASNGDSAQYFDGLAGIEEVAINALSIYPNPVTNNLTVETLHTIDSITIYTSTGQEIVSMQNTASLNVSQLHSGIYFVKVISEGTETVQQFIKN
ncbi:MAG: hypothetical protein ACI849_001010 [Patiriisocius sp.]|jgi:hypothetical protein